MKKKTVLAMLVMCMVFSASACSDKSAEKSAPEKQKAAQRKRTKQKKRRKRKKIQSRKRKKQRSDLCLSAIFPNISP